MFDDGVVEALWLTESDRVQVDVSCRLRFHAYPSPPVGGDLSVVEDRRVAAVEDCFAGQNCEVD